MLNVMVLDFLLHYDVGVSLVKYIIQKYIHLCNKYYKQVIKIIHNVNRSSCILAD